MLILDVGTRYVCRTLGIRDHYLVNTSALVAYQGKPVSLPPERKPHGMMFDHVLTIYKSTSDNGNRLNPKSGDMLPRMNEYFLNVTNIKEGRQKYSPPHEN